MGKCYSRGFLHKLIRTCGVFVEILTKCRFLRIKDQILKENYFCQMPWLWVLAEQNIYSPYNFHYSNCLIQVKTFLYFSFISKARMTFTVNSWGRDKLQSLPTLSLSLTLFARFLFYYSCKILSYFSIWSPQVDPKNIYMLYVLIYVLSMNIYIYLILILASLVEKAF